MCGLTVCSERSAPNGPRARLQTISTEKGGQGALDAAAPPVVAERRTFAGAARAEGRSGHLG
eukprot:10615425-Alexandrium_andersonii.AAC.1